MASSSRRSARAGPPVVRTTAAIPVSEFPSPYGSASPESQRASEVLAGHPWLSECSRSTFAARDIDVVSKRAKPARCSFRSASLPFEQFRLTAGRRPADRSYLRMPGRMPRCPERTNSCDAGCFGRAVAIDEPGQRRGKFDRHARLYSARGADQSIRSQRGFRGAIAHQPLHGVIALARCG